MGIAGWFKTCGFKPKGKIKKRQIINSFNNEKEGLDRWKNW